MTLAPRTTTWPVWPPGSKAPPSSMIATSKPTGTPTEPALRWRGGSGLHAIGEDGDFRHPVKLDHAEPRKLCSSSAKTLGGRGADEERTKRSRQSATSLAIVPSLGENCLMHGRHGGVPRRLKRGQPSGEAVGVKSGGTHDARARRQRGEQRGDRDHARGTRA